jgi:hypothetical protein
MSGAGAVLAASLLAGALAGFVPAGVSALSCVAWTGVQPPNVGAGDNALLGVSTIAPCDAWAVGYSSNGTAKQTLIEHWTGTAWKHVASPNPGGSANTNVLNAVAATSRTNAWAVGSYDSASGAHALIEHWNGTTWKQVTSPAPAIFLGGVTALSATSAWAVGYSSNGTAIQTLIEHWNGTAWTLVNSPNPAGAARQNLLYSVTATSSRNAWAVGDYFPGAQLQTLILHWDGKAWRHVPSPNRGGSAQQNILHSVAAASRTSAWAAGTYGLTEQTLIEHWNGTAWKLVKSPNPGGPLSENFLAGVTAISSSNAWAVGGYFDGTRFSTLALHWNGTAWKQVATPNPGGSARANLFNGVAATSRSNIWAVGAHFNGTVNHTLAVHCC